MATDLHRREELPFTSGALRPALAASIAIPGLFTVGISRRADRTVAAATSRRTPTPSTAAEGPAGPPVTRWTCSVAEAVDGEGDGADVDDAMERRSRGGAGRHHRQRIFQIGDFGRDGLTERSSFSSMPSAD